MPRVDLLPEKLREEKNVLFDDFVIAATKGLYLERREDRVLIVDPDSASWAILPEMYGMYLDKMEDPLFFSQLCILNPEHSPDFYREMVEKMHHHGFITIDGRGYFPSPEIMWKPLDDYPVYPRSFYFHTTDACNLRCTYCYAKAEGEGKNMSVQTACTIIDRILQDIPDDYVYIEFHGGEPLLLKDHIYEIVRYGEKKSRSMGKRIDFSIQTNGVLLDREMVEFAKSRNMKIGVSIDGPPELHNRFRKDPKGKGSFESVWKSVTEAEKQGFHCGFIGVAHEPGDYLRAYEFLVSRGIMSFKLNYSAALGRASDTLEFGESRGRDMAMGCLEMLDVASQFNRESPVKVKIHDMNFYIAALLTKKREYMCLRSPCGVGRSIIAFGTEGEIFPCEEMSTYPEFKCGDISSGIPLTELIDNSEAIQKLRGRCVEKIPRCSECPWRRFCAGKCLHKAYHTYQEIQREDPMCSFYATIFPELMWRINEDPGMLTLM